jgi:hypothetical protein
MFTSRSLGTIQIVHAVLFTVHCIVYGNLSLQNMYTLIIYSYINIYTVCIYATCQYIYIFIAASSSIISRLYSILYLMGRAVE